MSNSIIEQLDKAVYNAVSGNISAFDTYINFMEIKDSLEEHIATLKTHAMDEAVRYNGQVHMGYEVKVAAVGGRYSYDHIPEVVELKRQLKNLEALHQTAFKHLEKGVSMVDEDGVQVEPATYKPNGLSIILKQAY